MEKVCVGMMAIALSIFSVGTVSAETQIPYPEGLWQKLTCTWDESAQIPLQEMSSKTIALSDMSNVRYYQSPFTMTTDGMKLFNISLPRWTMAETTQVLAPGFGCTASRINISCNSAMTNMVLSRSSLKGFEINHVEMNQPIHEGGPNIEISTFSCIIAP